MPTIKSTRKLARAAGGALGIGVSLAALAAMVHLESHPFEADVALAREPVRSIVEQAPQPWPAATPAPTSTAMDEPADGTNDSGDADPAVAVMPDLSGVRLSTARKRLRALGLQPSPRDRWGDRIYPGTHRFYRVRTQQADAGAELAPGTRVALEAHRIGFAAGY